MPAALRKPLEGRMAIHSAVKAYAPDGTYGEKDKPKRSMDIRPHATPKRGNSTR